MSEILFRPAKDQHSIQEFNFSFFLKNPFDDIEKFVIDFNNQIKEDFTEHEFLVQSAFDDKGNKDEKKMGFFFSKYKRSDESEIKSSDEVKSDNQNTPIELIIGLNEIQDLKQRTKISYHNFDYSNWFDVRERIINLFTKINSDIIIEAFNLTYKDIFYWDEKRFPQLDSFFKADSTLIPQQIILSDKPCSFSITVTSDEFLEDEENPELYKKILFDDSLKVQIRQHKNKQNYRILIEHSVVHKFIETTSILNFFKSSYNFRIIDLAQKNNKNLLRKILKYKIQETIKLNKKNENSSI